MKTYQKDTGKKTFAVLNLWLLVWLWHFFGGSLNLRLKTAFIRNMLPHLVFFCCPGKFAVLERSRKKDLVPMPAHLPCWFYPYLLTWIHPCDYPQLGSADHLQVWLGQGHQKKCLPQVLPLPPLTGRPGSRYLGGSWSRVKLGWNIKHKWMR